MPSPIYFSLSPHELAESLQAPPLDSHLCSNNPSLDRERMLQSIPQAEARPIILTGHQPVFHHPGILIKNMLAQSLADALGGTAVHLVHDCDQEEILFQYPQRSGEVVRKRSFRLNAGQTILRDDPLQAQVREQFLRLLDSLRAEIRLVFAPDRAREIRPALDIVQAAAERSQRAMDIPEAVRTARRSRTISISSSDLFASNAFRCFVDHVALHAADFRAVHNQVLSEYRTAHGIKNPAQPLPDLKEGELPFWILRNGEREPLLENAAREGVLLPRAVTLTLFCRLFLCDLFIHGLGGERYDRITDEILKRFFAGAGAPFIAASATLALPSRADLRLDDRPQCMIDRDLRYLQFDPTRFLPAEHEVRRTKEKLIAQRADISKRPEIHPLLLAANDKARALLQSLEADLERERLFARASAQNRTFFSSRDLPFFFYDLSPIEQAVRNYCAGLEKRSPTASLAEVRS